jgi:ribosomal protein L9
MSLSKKKQQDDFLTAVKQEAQLTEEAIITLPTTSASDAAKGAGKQAQQQAQQAQRQGAQIIVEEKATIQMERDGGVSKMDVNGQLKLSIFDPDNSKIFLETTGLAQATGENAFKTQLRPGVDKKLWTTDGILALSDASKGFALGSDNASVLLKWRQSLKGDDAVPPFTLNFWPNSENGFSVVSAEYNVEQGRGAVPVKQVIISIPCPAKKVDVRKVDGEWKLAGNMLHWMVDEINEDKCNGSFEFKIPEVDGDAFFPINITFSSNQLMSGLSVTGVKRVDDKSNVEFVQDVSLSADKFIIE